jgi:hypothetical protein
MKLRITLIATAVAALAAAFGSSPAHALFRAYLSGNGNDANPCTLAQPCRLLPAALAAVDDGGDIWMLDSANYNTGLVTVSKSVTILAIPGAVASIVANGDHAMTIDGAGIAVNLQNLLFRHLSGGNLSGSRVVQASNVSVEGCTFVGLHMGVKLEGTTGFSITGSSVKGVLYGVYVTGAAAGSVANTTFSGPGYSAISTWPNPSTNRIRLEVTDVGVISHNFGVAIGAGSDVVLAVNRSRFANMLSSAVQQQGTSGSTLSVSGTLVGGSSVAFANLGFGGTFESFQDNVLTGNATTTSGTITNRTKQ